MDQNTGFIQDNSLIQGFTVFSPAQLERLKADLSLFISIGGLQLCQRHFASEFRNPAVGELRFLSALATALYHLPNAARLEQLHFEDASGARIWRDICNKRAVLSPTATCAPTWEEIMGLSAAYLARAGRAPEIADLAADTSTALAVACCGTTPALALDLDGVTAAIAQPQGARMLPRPGQFLLALEADKGTTLATTVARFQSTYAPFCPIPVAVIGTEGIGVHLAELPCGAEFDLMHASHEARAGGTAAFAEACPNTVIFAVNEHVTNMILTGGAPVTLIGRLLPVDRVILKNGLEVLFNFPRSFIAAWQSRHDTSLTVPKCPAATASATVSLCEDGAHLLAGVRFDGDTLPALTALLQRVFVAGGDMKSATLACILSLPPRQHAQALALMLDYHRFTAELALPATTCRTLPAGSNERPMLTVFMATKRGVAPTETNLAALTAALADRDFAALRRVIYQRELGDPS